MLSFSEESNCVKYVFRFSESELAETVNEINNDIIKRIFLMHQII